MWQETDDTLYVLSDAELGVLRRAAAERRRVVDPTKRAFSKAELVAHGLVREAFDERELVEAGVGSGVITSKDRSAAEVGAHLGVGSPHPSRIGKWQLPIPLPRHRPVMISFPAGSRMSRRVQPTETGARPGGALRVVLSGSLRLMEERFGPGEWFFVPNGVPYELTSDEIEVTNVLYLFDFVSSSIGGRFSFETRT